MLWIRKTILWALSGAILGVTAQAIADESPPAGRSYQAIIDRNPFGLKDAPPPAPAPPIAPPPKKDIYLTGITAMFSPKRAYIMTKDQQGNIERETFAENDEKKGLKVLEINEIARSVRVRQSTGEEILLKFDTHRAPVEARVAAAPPPQPGGGPVRPQGPRAGAALPVPPGYAGGTPTASPRPGMVTVPARNLSSNPLRDVRTGRQGFVAGGAGAYTPPNQINPNQPGQNQNPAFPAPPSLTPEEQVIMMEVQRLQNPQVPFPPTPGLDHGGPPAPNTGFPAFPQGP